MMSFSKRCGFGPNSELRRSSYTQTDVDQKERAEITQCALDFVVTQEQMLVAPQVVLEKRNILNLYFIALIFSFCLCFSPPCLK